MHFHVCKNINYGRASQFKPLGAIMSLSSGELAQVEERSLSMLEDLGSIPEFSNTSFLFSCFSYNVCPHRLDLEYLQPFVHLLGKG